MSIRIILTPLFGSAADTAALSAGLSIARRFQAHLGALFVRIDPLDAIPLVGEGVSPAIVDQLTEAAAAEMDRQRAVARQRFEAACAAAGMALADAPGSPGPSAGWLEETGRRDDLVPRRARVSDLVIFGPGGDDDRAPDLAAVLEATLFESGRPLLLMPAVAPSSLGERVAIAWNGSAEGARAVAGALPFLDGAQTVHVLTVETKRIDPETAQDLIGYLRWRGVACARLPVAARDESVAEALLEAASAAGADLLVMGGYGRTRLSELVLGGVTRHVLSHLSLPVLMAH